jgi:hypothetical protein
MRYFGALLGSLACAGCLPSDTRPPPAEVTVTASSSDFTLNDIPATATTDGFDIVVERLLVNVGQAALDDGDSSSACNEYSSPNYTRLFDFKQVSAPHELGLAFATGRCAFGYSVRFPNYATVLDVGATSEAATLMRTPGSDPDATDAGVSVYIEGVAVRGGEIKHFAWPFRKRVGYVDCGFFDDETGAFSSGLSLASNEKTSINLEVHAEGLFQNRPGTLAHFQPYADADANGDGEITFDELWTVPLDAVVAAGFDAPMDVSVPPPVSTPPAPIDPAYSCFDSDGNLIGIKTLGDYAYCELLPTLVRFERTGACFVQIGRAKDDR